MNSEQPSQAALVTAKSAGSILVVDDEPALRRATARILESAGYAVQQAEDGSEAGAAIESRRFDAVVSDICMPGMNGIELLRRARERDADVPVLFVTGRPAVETAVEAMNLGALRYLIKPVSRDDLIKNVEEVVLLGRLARMRREAAHAQGTTDNLFADRRAMEASLDNALATLWMAYQPIVDWSSRSVAAYEALMRMEEPTLPHPGALLLVAQRLDRMNEVGRAVRAAVARDLTAHPRTQDTFVNLHPVDLKDETLYAADGPLAPFAARIVLEITECEALDKVVDVVACTARLRKLGFRIAIDDLGSGYSGLSYFAQLTPDVAKIDISLVRGIDADAVKQKLVGSLVALCTDLGVIVLAEGVETPAEKDTLIELGCNLLQGYLFARPGKPFPTVAWPEIQRRS